MSHLFILLIKLEDKMNQSIYDPCESVDEMLQRGIQALKKNGVDMTPAWQRCKCKQYPTPVVLTLKNPLARFCTMKSRKQNIALTVAESLWIASGMNDLDELPGHYAKAIYNYADNGKSYRAGYGPRIRFYNETKAQYYVRHQERTAYLSRGVGYTDQLRFCIEQLKKDKFTRQAVITIHDPNKDDFDLNGDLLKTKDTPCTRSVQFMCDSEGKLNCYVQMRSNDILHGMSVINVAEFTFLQQIVAQICGLPLGQYSPIANSFHFYEDTKEMIDACGKEKIEPIAEMKSFSYAQEQIELKDFDKAIDIMLAYEAQLVRGEDLTAKNPFFVDRRLQVFSDYAEVFRLAQCRKHKVDPVNGEFFHPQLQVLYQKGML